MVMNIDSEYVRQMSTQLASYEVQGALARLDRSEERYRAQLSALQTLRSALSTFTSKVRELNRATSSMVVNTASFSQEGYASATVGTRAVEGSYQFFVGQLASAHQLALEGLTASAVEGGALNSGILTISQADADPFQIDLSTIDSNSDGITSMEELAAAINAHADNEGVRATLVRNNGEILLVLTSERTGADAAISLSVTGGSVELADAVADPRVLAAAQNAEIYLGGEGGIKLTSATNRFDGIIEGVSLTFSKAHASGEQPLTIDIRRDDSATKEKVQAFVSAYNSLLSTLKQLTVSGDEHTERGPLAGDASVRAIQTRLQTLFRTQFDGVSLASFGITVDRSGQLSIDNARFEAALAKDPEALEALFKGSDNLLGSIDKALATYTSSADGMLKGRIERVNESLRRLDVQFENIQRQYDTYYKRYLQQFTLMMQTMQAMQQTQGMF